MAVTSNRIKTCKDLLLAAAIGTIVVSGSLFGGWFVAFMVMGVIGKSLLVGMYYLAWPVVFPILAAPVVFVLLVVVIPLFRHPYNDMFRHRGFTCGVLLPTIVVAMAIMLANCPLDIGGTLLSRGWEAFG